MIYFPCSHNDKTLVMTRTQYSARIIIGEKKKQQQHHKGKLCDVIIISKMGKKTTTVWEIREKSQS